MASIIFEKEASFVSVARPNTARKESVAVAEAVAVSAMNEDDASALRTVSMIIFAVVALGTLAMFATVLVCL